MNRNNQKWYDKPITKLILIAIALIIFPLIVSYKEQKNKKK